MNEIIRKRRSATHSSIHINRNLKSGTPLSADDQVILVGSYDELQRSVYNLQNTAKDFKMEISTEKTNINTLRENTPFAAKFAYTISLLNKSTVLIILGVTSRIKVEKI
jgi:hypothetical protein